MALKPQKTKFQKAVLEILVTSNRWAVNPWRRYSFAIVLALIGYFFGSSLGMVSAVVELMDPIGAFLSVVFIEILIQLRRSYRNQREKKFIVLSIDSLRIGVFYGFFTESLKLL